MKNGHAYDGSRLGFGGAGDWEMLESPARRVAAGMRQQLSFDSNYYERRHTVCGGSQLGDMSGIETLEPVIRELLNQGLGLEEVGDEGLLEERRWAVI